MHEPTVTRVELHAHGNRTRMTLTDGPYPAGRGHAEAGWNAAFDKLGFLALHLTELLDDVGAKILVGPDDLKLGLADLRLGLGD